MVSYNILKLIINLPSINIIKTNFKEHLIFKQLSEEISLNKDKEIQKIEIKHFVRQKKTHTIF